MIRPSHEGTLRLKSTCQEGLVDRDLIAEPLGNDGAQRPPLDSGRAQPADGEVVNGVTRQDVPRLGVRLDTSRTVHMPSKDLEDRAAAALQGYLPHVDADAQLERSLRGGLATKAEAALNSCARLREDRER